MSSDENNLKVALVTGATTPIGSAIAALLSKSGLQLVITDCNENQLSKVAKECEESAKYSNKWKQQNGKWIKVQRTVAIPLDYKNESDCRQLITSLIDTFGKLDLFVNYCANEMPSNLNDSNLMDIYDEVMAKELRPLILLTQLTVPHLESTKGNIINVFSSSAVKVDQSLLANCMADCAAQQFIKCVALEIGVKGLRINSITSDSNVKQELIDGIEVNQHLMDEFVERLEKNNNLCRMFCKMDVANAVIFLSSNQANFINGFNLVVDGGANN